MHMPVYTGFINLMESLYIWLTARLRLKMVWYAYRGLEISLRIFSFSPARTRFTEDVVLQVLHGLAKDQIVHELEKVFIKVRLGLLAQVGVELDVRPHPRTLLEHQYSVHLLQLYAQPEVLLEDAVVQDVLPLVSQCEKQLLGSVLRLAREQCLLVCGLVPSPVLEVTRCELRAAHESSPDQPRGSRNTSA